jgi:hypothetical protein
VESEGDGEKAGGRRQTGHATACESGSVIGGSIGPYPGPTPIHLTNGICSWINPKCLPGRAWSGSQRTPEADHRTGYRAQIQIIQGVQIPEPRAPQRAHGDLAGAGGRVGSRPLAAASPGSVVGRSGDFVASRHRLQLLERCASILPWLFV